MPPLSQRVNVIFVRGPSLPHRLALAIVLSILLIVLDHRLDSFGAVRIYLNSLVSPLQYMANVPSDMLSWSARRLTSHDNLLEENARLTRQQIMMNESLQRFALLKQENDRLRTLLGSPVRQDARKMIAQLMAVDNNPYNHQIVINKGSIDGVYEGQSVLDEQGIVGQVQHVGTTNSRVLLISDVTHAIPLRVDRNNVQVVASGSGKLNELFLNHMPHSTEIRVGDALVSSGLGNLYPEGYPVATITSVIRDESRPFASVVARPIAQLDRLKYLLLLWPVDAPSEPAAVKEES